MQPPPLQPSTACSPRSPIRRAAPSSRALPTGEATVNELVEPFGFSQPTISKHLKVLESAGLVSRGRAAQFRPVRLNAAPLQDAAGWLGDYERFWAESLDRLDDVCESDETEGEAS